MAKRDDLVKAYIGSLDICPVAVMASADGLSAKVGLCAAPSDPPFDTLFFAKLQHAELVLAQCPQGWVGLSPATLRDEVVNAAAVLGARFRTSAEIEVHASKAVEEIVERVEIMRLSGLLTKVNRDYKIYRQAQVARGLKAVPYQAHLDAFTLSLVRIGATESKS